MKPHHFTVDVEEYFHPTALAPHYPMAGWDDLPRRSPEVVRRILDFMARYQMNRNTTVFAGLKNLLNREYIATRHPIGPRTGLPRNFNVGVEMRF